MAKLDPYALKALLQAEKLDALGVNTSQLASERARALDYYYGNMSGDMPNMDGRSSAVSTDVADVVEGLMPGLMDIFASTDEPVKFNPHGPEDEQAAEQETDYVNHVFMQKNPGFMILYSFIKDALLSKIGIVKVSWETTEREERETYYNLGLDQIAVMLQDDDVEVTKRTGNPDGTFDVELTRKKEYGCAKAWPVPPEEFGIAKRARTLRDCVYCYHEPAGITESDLISQGYDEAQVKQLPTQTDAPRVETISRDTIEMGTRAQTAADEVNVAMRPIKITEHYIRMEYEKGEGPRLYKVTTGGNEFEVLNRNGKPDVEPIDTIPFACMTPVIVTHRFFGRSIADLVIDIQKIKTALYRTVLDNAYLANNQRIAVNITQVHERTLDDLLVNRPGGIVRVNGPDALMPLPSQPIGDFVFPLIEYVDSVKEARTGVSMRSQGIDADALSNQSATAANIAYTMVQAKEKLIARIFAETGIKDLFWLLHGTIRKNDREANTVRLRNRWVTVDPRQWKTRDDLTATVGLGTGSKQAQLAMMTAVMNIQKEMMLGHLPTCTPKNVYNSAAAVTRLTGEKNPDLYFTDPDSPQAQQMQQQPPPDPEMIKAHGQLQIQAAKAQSDLQLQQAQMQADLETERARMQADMALEQQKFEHQKQLEILKMHGDHELALAKAQRDHEIRLADLQSQHQGRLAEVKSKSEVAGINGDAQRDVAGQITPVLSELGNHMKALGDMQAKTLQAASSPRKTTLVRDAKGKATHAVSQIDQ